MAEKDMLAQVVANLVINSQQALVGRPSPRWIGITAGEEDGRLLLEIADNGPGIPAEIAARIYDPYFTTKPAGAAPASASPSAARSSRPMAARLHTSIGKGAARPFRISLPMGTGAALSPARDTVAGLRR